ncbi:hypothetical protein LEP1GSC165_2802 [Leptospira santarosai str. CBC523]|uniref:hypothetical protein n=1 Tax=Leptospira santarosai TaxID=28183 RepID=UPI0002BDB8C4|nr:hypothetical protein [Leptospira santarosai]EMO14931.1 hypothetical protein LEP1GSC165_2802 [Leptospira santarosai str. CBC523]
MSFLLLYQKDQAAPGFGIGSYKSGRKRDSYIKSEEEKDSRQRKEFAVPYHRKPSRFKGVQRFYL